MIHIDMKPEPCKFDADVRQPGNAFLARHPNPTSPQWNRNRYWSRCSTELYVAYDGICAYTGQWFSPGTAAVSVDHFYPKSTHPEKAYEWDNYRLTTQIINCNKGDRIVLDPFEITDGDIVLCFPACLVKPKSDLSPGLKSKAHLTIDVLKLNAETQANHRATVLAEYISGNVNMQFLQHRYPFIAKELERQGLTDKIKEMFKPLS